VFNQLIENRLQSAVGALVEKPITIPILVRPCPDARFGDYQTNSLMSLAKELKLNPRQLAEKVRERLDLSDLCDSVTIAGAGFLNFNLKPSAVANSLQAACEGRHLFCQSASKSRTLVIDFSSPNVAKPMHVGHIRSTILGECLARTFRLLGHNVITDNHIGDWGTQFGKLLVGWKKDKNDQALAEDPIREMERLYRTINKACEQDPSILDAARQELVKLQNGDSENLTIWRKMIELSQTQFDTIYARLGVKFDQTLGESFYNERLKGVVGELTGSGLAVESQGAMAVFFEGHPELKDHPALILKSDGGANYTTTDLATLVYRMETWHPDEIIYVTDSRQQLHFKQLFEIFRKWKRSENVKLNHVWFGTILGEDGKPFKTRSGEVVKLADLLNEAEERAYTVVTEKNAGLPEPQRREIARLVGLGAVKYADLLPNRQSDYVFNWDKMLAFNGNTAPYLLYAYTRIRSIFRKLQDENLPGFDLATAGAKGFALATPEELGLAKQLHHFGLVLEGVADECRPNFLCNYLYELAGQFSRFYDACPVLKAAEPDRTSRLALCELTGRVLKQGLHVLGIETTDSM
jgi:arginyl-tRNA synthetase